MKTTARFDQATRKLYIAFHNNALHPECSKQCAVGNICDNTDSWKYLSDDHGSLQLNYIGLVNQKLGKRLYGYTPLELLKIEVAFLKGCGYKLPLHHINEKTIKKNNKEVLFNGLCEVVSMLCDLDGITDVMNCSRFFKYTPGENSLVYNCQSI